jgi:uncharacterized protein (TIGR01777 family)
VRVSVTGATGMLGRQVTGALRDRGDEVTALSRDAARAREALSVDAVEWASPKEEPTPAQGVRGQDAVVHLLGEPLAQRWSERAKREIRDSRELGTRNLVTALAALPEEERPRTLVSQSAVGFYGARGDEPVDETEPAGTDFLAQVVSVWEAEARKAEELGLRVVTTRTGMVLSRTGGALEKMLPPFRLGVGGPVAGGRQYVPWVHLDDVVGAMLFCLDNEVASGPINLSAPEPVTNRELSKALGRVLRRPAIAPVPGLAVKLLYGEMAMVVTTGQQAVPKRLTEIGYEFRRPEVEPALRSTLEA